MAKPLEYHASHLHQALAESIEHAVEFPPGMIVTLVHAEITGDSKYAKGVISVLPETLEDEAIRLLKKSAVDIKEQLNKRLRLRQLPNLSWAIDRTEVEAAKIEKVMNELREKGEL
ncbi:MAG: ribosome-binding factor A [Patescibacteria group bacterium]